MQDMPNIKAFIENMPKAELHVHIEGTLEPDMRIDLARRNGLALGHPTPEALAASYEYSDLQSFLALYYEGLQVLRTERDFFDLARAYLRRAAAQNVLYAEMHFDPQAHARRGIEFGAVIRGLRRAQEAARAEFGIQSNLIMAFMRELSAESAAQTIERSLPYRDWIAGVGLDSDEKGNPPAKFAEVFARARAEGYMLTMHCDHLQENSVEHIRQCLTTIGVDRIDHGYHILDAPDLAEEARQRRICLTFCPTATPTDPTPRRAAELRQALELGLSVTLNTDDPAYMRSRYMNEAAVSAQAAAGLSAAQMASLARNAFRAAWIADADRQRFLRALDEYAGAQSGSC